jgi:hypothetical protein
MARPIKKDPSDILDYRVLWSSDTTWDDTDHITAAVFTASTIADDAAPLEVDSSSFTDTLATCWLSGGTVPNTYTVTCHITTAAGRELDKAFGVLLTDSAR